MKKLQGRHLLSSSPRVYNASLREEHERSLRACGAAGNKAGSHENREGQICIEPQDFCALAGIGKESGQMKKGLHSQAENFLNE